jgi:hypothetical protein
VDREPTIHLGTAGQRVEEFAERPQSQAREENTRGKHYRDEIPYPTIDQGRTRKERNAEIITFNASRMCGLFRGSGSNSSIITKTSFKTEFERITTAHRSDAVKATATKSSNRDSALPVMMQDIAAGRGRVFIACQEINAKYQGAIDAIANNQYYTKEQRDAIIAALRAQQKSEITATRQRIQYEERQKIKLRRWKNNLS